MNLIRSTLFTLFFFVWTTLIVVVFLPTLLFPPHIVMWSAKMWARGIVCAAWFLVGIKWEVRGLEHLPKGGCIIASKHQSAFETVALYLVCDMAAFILKKGLQQIPFYGWYVARIKSIAVDRSASVSALKDMVAQTKDRLAEGRQVIIFPEGTRVEYGKKGKYQAGVAAVYAASDVPVVPMALNSGKCWGKNSWMKYHGTIVFEFLPPIPAGLKKAEFMKRLEQTIEAGCKGLEE